MQKSILFLYTSNEHMETGSKNIRKDLFYFIWKDDGNRIPQTFLKKNIVQEITQYYVNTDYVTSVIKTEWNWQRDRYKDEENIKENPEMYPY